MADEITNIHTSACLQIVATPITSPLCLSAIVTLTLLKVLTSVPSTNIKSEPSVSKRKIISGTIRLQKKVISSLKC